MKILTILMLLSLTAGCCMQPAPAEVKNCKEIYYSEHNAGTMSNIVVMVESGSMDIYRYYGVYIRNSNGTITLKDAGNVGRFTGSGWKKINKAIHPDRQTNGG